MKRTIAVRNDEYLAIGYCSLTKKSYSNFYGIRVRNRWPEEFTLENVFINDWATNRKTQL